MGEFSPESHEGLIPEWQNLIEEYKESPRGREALDDREVYNYLAWSSDRVKQMEAAVLSGAINSENITPSLAREMYYSYPSFLTMRERVPVLRMAAVGMNKELTKLEKGGDHEQTLLKSRRLASVYEELSTVTTGEESSEHEQRAATLNLRLSESNILRVAESPRKLHAGMSIYDIYYRRLGKKIEAREGPVFPHERDEALQMQASSHLELADAIAELKKARKFPRSQRRQSDIGGALGELQVEARANTIIIENNLLGQVYASQSFLRQDNTHREGINGLSKWLSSFDLRIGKVNSHIFTPIEVKKRVFASDSPASERWQKKDRELVARYLPNISVILFRMGWSNRDYLNYSESYCRGTANELLGRQVSDRQRIAMDTFRSQVDAELLEIIQRHTTVQPNLDNSPDRLISAAI